MNLLGNGLSSASHHEDSLSVREAELSMKRRLGVSEHNILVAQCNLARTYVMLGRLDEALHAKRDVHSGFLKLVGEEHVNTSRAALNYASTLTELKRFKEAKPLLRKTVPVVRRVLGENHETTLKMRWLYARALFEDSAAALDDLREAVTTLEDAERIARRVLGDTHPTTEGIEYDLQNTRAALRARETPSPGSS